jgi:hypothetical protein
MQYVVFYILWLKGTMSEAELHIIRARLQGGIDNKARRGELKMRLPVGFVYDHNDEVKLDPDSQVQESIRLLFSTYKRLASASATVKYFRENNLQFPRRQYTGVHKGELMWGALEHHRILQVLHNPRYAGVFVFGKTRTNKNINGHSVTREVSSDEWHVVIKDAHVGYIAWEDYQANIKQLKENGQAYGHDRRKSPPREGPALLQGIVICGNCGQRMTLRYYSKLGKLVPRYMCQRNGIEYTVKNCQEILGAEIDEKIGEILLQVITPLSIDIAFSVEQQIKLNFEKSTLLRKQQVERAKYEADLARRRFMNVDPDNRLVANTLESEWNQKLRYYQDTLDEYETQTQADYYQIDEKKIEQIKSLTKELPLVWNNPKTPDREKKRLVRLVIEDVTLKKTDKITMHVRFKGGATQTLSLDLPKPNWHDWTTDPKIISLIDELLNDHFDFNVAQHLNESGLVSGKKRKFNSRIIAQLRKEYNLKSYHDRLKERGFLTADEMAAILKITPAQVKKWYNKGYLRGKQYNDKLSCLYEPLGNNPPIKDKWKINRIGLNLK